MFSEDSQKESDLIEIQVENVEGGVFVGQEESNDSQEESDVLGKEEIGEWFKRSSIIRILI